MRTFIVTQAAFSEVIGNLPVESVSTKAFGAANQYTTNVFQQIKLQRLVWDRTNHEENIPQLGDRLLKDL